MVRSPDTGCGPEGLGICLDATSGIWVQTADATAHTGDPNAFLFCNEFEGVDQPQAVHARQSAQIFVTDALVPRAG